MSDFRIKTCVLGMVSTNCYLIYDEGKRETIIVDPADNAAYILNKCREMELTPVAIFLTHGHFDHILAVKDIKRAFGCPVYAGRNEEALLKDPSMNLSGTLGSEQISLEADHLLRDGETVEVGGYSWKVIATPGHTAGCVCYYQEQEGVLVSGDTLFADSLGRTDLPTASPSEILRSITGKLFLLPEETMVYPGHGDPTTIGHEKVYNPAAAWAGQKKDETL